MSYNLASYQKQLQQEIQQRLSELSFDQIIKYKDFWWWFSTKHAVWNIGPMATLPITGYSPSMKQQTKGVFF